MDYSYIFFLPVSIFLKGEQMIPIMNAVGTHAAVYGNHDFGINTYTFIHFDILEVMTVTWELD